nr:uncharacterized protein LOC120965369 isoform X2 [Aegilops tauschii subsp. strangulata]
MLAVQQCPYMEVQISKECSTPATLIAAMSGLEVKREDDDSAEQGRSDNLESGLTQPLLIETKEWQVDNAEDNDGCWSIQIPHATCEGRQRN